MAGLIVLGTASNAGKSALVAALLRIYADRGYKVCPFKAQNMALNSGVTRSGEEIGRAQMMQAEAARTTPDARMNPILLKPTGDGVSQVIVNGNVYKNMTTREYYDAKPILFQEAIKAYRSLEEEYDIVIAEGAGSASEINLKSVDIVNMGFAKAVDIPAILVADIDRGGMFASVVGTYELFDDFERQLFKGTVINKFRGDVGILEPGLYTLEKWTKRPVLGVVPYLDIELEAEDSLSKPFSRSIGGDVDIAVVQFPHISNFTDMAPLLHYSGVSLRYFNDVEAFGDPDLLILPGTKNTINDLNWLKETGIYARILRHSRKGGYIFGICGGFQMLGTKISDPLKIENGKTAEGLRLLEMETMFGHNKLQRAIKTRLNYGGELLKYAEGMDIAGYELHMGESKIQKKYACLTDEGGIVERNIYGSYIHGFFDSPGIADGLIQKLKGEKGLEGMEESNFSAFKETQYDLLAESVKKAISMKMLDQIIGI